MLLLFSESKKILNRKDLGNNIFFNQKKSIIQLCLYLQKARCLIHFSACKIKRIPAIQMLQIGALWAPDCSIAGQDKSPELFPFPAK